MVSPQVIKTNPDKDRVHPAQGNFPLDALV